MSKPLLIIRVPLIDNFDEKQNIIDQLLTLQKQTKDYNILPVMESSVTRVEFELMSVKEVDLNYVEELKKTILNSLENHK